MHIPEHAVAPIAGELCHDRRGGVLHVDPQLEPQEAELVEAPAGHELHRTRGDTPPTRDRSDHVADLALTVVELELDDRCEAEEGAVVVADGETGAASVLTAPFVAPDPPAHEGLVGARRDAREAHD